MSTLINCTTESQNGQILELLQSGGTITQGEAASNFGCWRLSARIADLRSYGFPVQKIWEKRGRKRYARYYLENEA